MIDIASESLLEDMAEFEGRKGANLQDDSSDDSASLFEVRGEDATPPSLPESFQKSQDDYRSSGEDSLFNSEEDKSPGENRGGGGGVGLQSESLATNDELILSPILAAELAYTPMRITRSMASLRNAFNTSLGLSVGGATEPKMKNGSSELVTRKTGKRSVARGLRSGWSQSKSKCSGQESRNHVDTDPTKVPIQRRRGRPKSSGKVFDVTTVDHKPKPVERAKEGGLERGTGFFKLDKETGEKRVSHSIAEEDGSGTDKLMTHADEADIGQVGEDDSSGVTEGEMTKMNDKTEIVATRSKSSGVGWVMCDDCRKWRRISAELADTIEAIDARWTCRENPNKDYADCSIPQEKTNAEINAELNISEISSSEEDDDNDAAVDSKSRASWTLIRHNIFRHRRPKKLDDDDSLICHCKPPADGGPGCGDDCFNRMVNVECSSETCPCGESCSNQQFRKRMYGKVALIRCGKKGFGLRIMDNAPKGTFIIEYVGEVLDIHTFEQRQKEYARQRQKHFYFMTLNSSEVIDACRKGNLGRFINHSCEPNCQTEKWCVNGEICIGLFAIRDLVRGEEITFNYNFERLYGAAAKRCRCGSSQCQGFIGGNPSNPGAVVETDSDEDLEPIMLKEESEEENIVDNDVLVQETKASVASETLPWEPKPANDNLCKRKSVGAAVRKTTCRVKRVQTSIRTKKGTSRGLTVPSKSDSYRTSRSLYSSEVEEKLDKLLNQQGGLVKKKDTPKQYLKLLVISTASGDASGEGVSCSIRDLSLLLDALLKTSSRSILTEVIQKNGLQLLHNLVKQSRKSWNKIPILRKLMKVLELLASRKILKDKDMTSTPPRNGMESFVKSISELTRHDDIEVQQISRRFQKNWLPDSVANEKGFGEHRYWGPDRFCQKRELFRSKPEDRPQKPFFRYSDDYHQRDQDDYDDTNSGIEQEPKRRKRISRWDELPAGFDSKSSLPATTPGPQPSRSTPQDSHQSVHKDEPPGYSPHSTHQSLERSEPPGYSSNSGKSSHGRSQGPNFQKGPNPQQIDYSNRQQPKEQWARQHFHLPYRPPNGQSGYMGKPRMPSQDFMTASNSQQMEIPSRVPVHPGGPYPSVQHHRPKYQHHPGSQRVFTGRPTPNGCFNGPPAPQRPQMRPRGPPPNGQFQTMGGGFFGHPSHGQHPSVPPRTQQVEEPPVPGL